MSQPRHERFNTHNPPSPTDVAGPVEEDIDPAQVPEQLASDPDEVPNATDPQSPVETEELTDEESG